MTLVLANPAPGEPASWDLTPQQLLSFLMVDKATDGKAIEVKFNAEALRAGLADLAQQIDRAPENARFVFNDDTRQLEVIKPGKIGRALDITTTLTRMNDALARGDQQVTLAVNEQRPDFYDDANAAAWASPNWSRRGNRYYAGSSAERMKNIGAASTSQHGVIVKPGEVFSFNHNLGDVSLDTGYAEALIIYNGRTIKGVGGGVCQVSTTAFRAAFNGGYPIIERWPHAYRVGWYERGSGPGLDASVFSPVRRFQIQERHAVSHLDRSVRQRCGGPPDVQVLQHQRRAAGDDLRTRSSRTSSRIPKTRSKKTPRCPSARASKWTTPPTARMSP